MSDSDLSDDFDDFVAAARNMNDNRDADNDEVHLADEQEQQDGEAHEHEDGHEQHGGHVEADVLVIDPNAARQMAENLARAGADAAILQGVADLAQVRNVARANAAAVPGVNDEQALQIAEAAAAAAINAAQERVIAENAAPDAGRVNPHVERAVPEQPDQARRQEAGAHRTFMFTEAQFDHLVREKAPPRDDPKVDKIKLPEFSSVDHEEFENFRRKAQIAYSHNNWRDQSAKCHVASKLTGRAAIKTQHIAIGSDPAAPEPDSDAKTFKAFLDELELCFIHPEESALAKTYFKQAKQNLGESPIDWHQRCRKLFRRGYKKLAWNTAQDLIDQFICGLADEHLAVYLSDKQPGTYDQCLTLLQGKQGRTAQIRASRKSGRSIRTLGDDDQPEMCAISGAPHMAAVQRAIDAGIATRGGVTTQGINALHPDSSEDYDPYMIGAYNFVGDGLSAPTSKSANAALRARGPPGSRGDRSVSGKKRVGRGERAELSVNAMRKSEPSMQLKMMGAALLQCTPITDLTQNYWPTFAPPILRKTKRGRAGRCSLSVPPG